MAEVTGTPPPALASRPDVLPGLGAYLEAFEVLCGSRSADLAGPRPIPLSEIESYCRLTGWRDQDAVTELVAIVQALDAVYLDDMARKSRGDEAASRATKESDRRAQIGRLARFDSRWSGRRGQK